MTSDAGKQQTRVGEIRELISSIHGFSVDIREKAYELASPPKLGEEPDKISEVATENVSNELTGSLRGIKGILREAYDTLSAFV